MPCYEKKFYFKKTNLRNKQREMEEKWITVKRSLKQQTIEIISDWRFFRVSLYFETEKFCLIVQHIFRLKRWVIAALNLSAVVLLCPGEDRSCEYRLFTFIPLAVKIENGEKREAKQVVKFSLLKCLFNENYGQEFNFCRRNLITFYYF